jgi:outer membrane usher protein FimD/PapC
MLVTSPRIFRFLMLSATAYGLCGTPHASGQLLAAALEQPRAAAVRPLPGVEINYDLLTPSDVAVGPARLEGVVSGERGELRTSVLVDPGAEASLARLDTRWQTQLSGPLQTLVVGDTFGSGGGWSRPVRMGGLRLGRSLSLRPGFIAAPQAGIASSAALPRAPTGGQPSVAITAPLQAGASDYEIEAGRLRNGWSTADDHYGESYAAAAWRAGLGAELTAEARTEWTPSRAATGLEVSRGFGKTGSLNAVLAQSATAQEAGVRWGMGLAHNADGVAWMLSSDSFERGFTPLATASGDADPRGRLQAGATLTLSGGTSARVSYARQTAWDSPAAAVLGLGAQFSLLEHSSLALNYSQQAGAQPGWQAGLTLTVPLANGP